MEHTYIVIDLKSFYASVECVERNLDPMTTKLVVADPTRTEKTICLAVSPALKKLGVKNRCRVFQIPKNIKYIMAPPQMSLYIEYSSRIYSIYLRYFSENDIYVYSIDECFIDVTNYLKLYKKTPKEIAKMLIDIVKKEIGINATVGIGPNMYLAKVALDIISKHVPDFIGILDYDSYNKELGNHEPLTDFWRIGPGISNRLRKHNIYTMNDIKKANEDLLYKELGKDAELLIDHAYGIEPVTIEDVKKYKPKSSSLSIGQVLASDYNSEDLKIILKEMLYELCLQLTDKNLYTNNIALYIGYSKQFESYASGSISLTDETSSATIITPLVLKLYEKIIDENKTIKRLNIAMNTIDIKRSKNLSLYENEETYDDEKDIKAQQAVNKIKKKYGKNSILKVLDLQEQATQRERNNQIGGHSSGKQTKK